MRLSDRWVKRPQSVLVSCCLEMGIFKIHDRLEQKGVHSTYSTATYKNGRTTVTKQEDVIEFVLSLATEKCLRVRSWFSRNRWRSLIGSDRGHRNCLIRDDAVSTAIFSGSPHSSGLGVTQETTGEPEQSRHINEVCATSFAHCEDAVIVSEMSPLRVTCTLQVVVEL